MNCVQTWDTLLEAKEDEEQITLEADQLAAVFVLRIP